MIKWKTIVILFLIFLIIFFTTCATFPFNLADTYQGKVILSFPNSSAYLFPNSEAERLVIIIDDSGWDSVLGVKQDNRWISINIGALFMQDLRNYFSVLIPEILNRQPGMTYSDNMHDRMNFTAENLLAGYLESINGYLAENNFSSIILVGISTSAALIPLVYERMNNKDDVIAMVSIGFGGLSLYESLEILHTTRADWTPEYVAIFNDILTRFHQEVSNFPDTFAHDYYIMTERWLSSFIHIRPFDYYKNINIPVLFVHEIYARSIPVESTIYIQENLPDKSFDFIYFPWAEVENNRRLVRFIREITQWILSL